MNHPTKYIALATYAAAALIPTEVEAKKQPNFVVIVADDMGYADASTYGSDFINTPNIDRMAREGMKFTDFHANGAVSSPTRCALLTGRYQQRAGLESVIQVPRNKRDQDPGLPAGQVTFAEVLGNNGYETALIGKWHLGYKDQHHPLNFGFKKFVGFKSGNVDYKSHRNRYGDVDWWDGLEMKDMPGYTTTLLTDLSEQYIKENKDKPFCLYMAHAAPHSPMQGPGEEAVRTSLTPEGDKNSDRSNKEIYKDMVEELDRSVGRVLATLKECGIEDNTFVVFFSDNGPVLANGGSAGVYRGAKGQPWEGGHRVPGIIYMPGTVKGGKLCEETAMAFDLFPTMLEMAGVKFSAEKPLDGVSLTPLWNGKKLPQRKLFWGTGNGNIAVRDGDLKLVRLNRNGETSLHLYNLKSDPSEKNDLATERPDDVERLNKAIDEWAGAVYSEVPDQFVRAPRKKRKND